MTDYFADNGSDKRNEPTLGGHEPTLGSGHQTSQPSRARAAEQKTTPPGEAVEHERRDERRYIRVSPPFTVKLDDGNSFTGSDVSQGGFALYSERPFRLEARIKASLLIMAGNTELIVPVVAECRRCTEEASGNGYKAAFEIIDMETSHHELLRRIIRACLSGRQISVEGLLEGEDAQTPRRRQSSQGSTQAAAAQRPPKPMGRYIALFVAFGVLMLALAATAYRNFMLIEPSFAAVTAPRIDIRAPGPGILMEHGLTAGDRVERDEKLTRVKNTDLESDLILAKAAQSYNSQLIDNLDESLASSTQEVSVANASQPSSGETSSFETVSPAVAKTRIQQFKTARDFQSSRITALESRQSKNDIYSPCNCLVAWALSSADGTYINESERIMTLIRTGEDDIMVEALVHMDDIDNIDPNQQAYISLPNVSGPVNARVRSVALDIERQPRAGFPSWVRQQQNVASVLLVPEEPLPATRVGTPVDVRFTEDPFLGATAEWVWQGARSVIQFGEGIYDSLAGDADTAQAG
ncbi:PilZ domain-containing protein [Onishia niordana]|uniref:PilZ domain-containing protein n=1 Tax=Onishia niordana TaxID=2508711 RepID=UPI00109FD55E|nr:PilZ domain-containing protein [Halomonas niordiana]